LASLRYTAHALGDLERLARFLHESDPGAAERTLALIVESLLILQSHPLIGRPVSMKRRELVIFRGRTGYLAQYSFSLSRDEVAVLSVRHQREVDEH
jgi:plasmid stabilization system protein ParE